MAIDTNQLHLPGRGLDEDEAIILARRVAADEALWRPLARFEGADRVFESLHYDEHVGIWVISWMPGNDTGFHDHDYSSGAVAVALGTIREERMVWNGESQGRDATVGDILSFGDSEIHRMVNLSGEVCVTIHVYSPPLIRMGMYRMEPDGVVRRRSVGSDTELRA